LIGGATDGSLSADLDVEQGRPMKVPGSARVALVTGAARGIGAGIALRLARDGHDVAVLDRDEDRCAVTVAAVRAAGTRSMAVGADVVDETAARAAVEKVAAELGGPTVLVNNAGVPGFTVTDMTRSVAERIDVPFAQMEAEMAAAIPVGRAGTPEDVAHAVAFLVDERSGFVSGQVLYVAGGPVP
jgi:NAD(P)-dependent dehydrogenase (short-subunit alcohol dehydrogenase family)